VAPPEVKTTHIYKGAIAFIGLQLIGLGIAGYFPSLVNYLPFSTYLTSENAPPPINPRLQQCMRDHLFEYYDEHENTLRSSIKRVKALDVSALPEDFAQSLTESFDTADSTFAMVAKVRSTEADLNAAKPAYRPVHSRVRAIERDIRAQKTQLEQLEQTYSRESRADEVNDDFLQQLKAQIEEQKLLINDTATTFPEKWPALNERYKQLTQEHQKAVRAYNFTVDEAYQTVPEILNLLAQADSLEPVSQRFDEYSAALKTMSSKEASAFLKAGSKTLADYDGLSRVKSKIYKASKAMKGSSAKPEKAQLLIDEAKALYVAEVAWRAEAKKHIAPALKSYNEAIKNSIGLRLQSHLPTSDAKSIALCQSVHRDISLSF
jgi:DNA repair exonuclease SbcCD ATPase subunit